MEGLVCRGRGVGEGEEEVAGFEEGAGPAVDDEEGDGGGGGGAVVGVVDELGTVGGYVYLDHELVEFFVDLVLEERSEFDWGKRLERKQEPPLLSSRSRLSSSQLIALLPLLWHLDSSHRLQCLFALQGSELAEAFAL